jgi:hypothetical protein
VFNRRYFIPLHVKKAYRGRRGVAPLMLNLGARRTCVVNIMPWLLYLRVKSPVPLE